MKLSEDQELINKLWTKGYSNPFTLIKEALSIKPNFAPEVALEYLSKNSYRTGWFIGLPDELVTLIVEIGQLYTPHSVLDPACGLGQLLSKINYCDNITGLEINHNLADLGKILNPNLNIKTGDFINEGVAEKYDQIVVLPPFGVRVKTDHGQELSENAFLNKSLELLNPNGSLIALVPVGYLFSPRFEKSRKTIISQYYLEAIIDLKPGILKSTGIPTSIIVIKKSNPTNNDKVFFGEYGGDVNRIISDFQNKTGEFWVDRERLNNRIDRSFFNPRYDDLEKQLSGIEVKRLEEIAYIIRGAVFNREEISTDGRYLIMSGKNIKAGKLVCTPNDRYVTNLTTRQENAVLREGDIVVSLIFNNNKIYLHTTQDKIVVNNNCAIIRSIKYGPYLSSYISSSQGSLLVNQQMARKRHGSVIPSINISDLRQIKIPIVPIEDPNKLVDKNTPLEERYAITETLLEDQLVKKGWDVRRENRLLNMSLDLGLYIDGKLASFVEIKSPRVQLERIKQQLLQVTQKTSVETAFVVQDNNIYRYSNRSLTKLDEFPTVLEFSNDTIDIFQPTHNEVSSNLEKMVRQLLSQNKELLERTRRIETTVLEIKDILMNLQADFQSIKEERRDDEEKLILLYRKIDKRLGEKNEDLKEEINEYMEIAQSLITNWSKLEPLSKEYYPLAEYLFSKLQPLPNIDFSPVILQYCRTIENELLAKIFIRFTKAVVDKYPDLKQFLREDLDKDAKGNSKPTNLFATSILRAVGKTDDEIRYTFGQMHFILNLLLSEKIVKQSPIIKELKEFIDYNFDCEVVLSTKYLNEIHTIIKDFRNKCAHPSKLNLEDAMKCKKRIPEDIDTFIDCQRS